MPVLRGTACFCRGVRALCKARHETSLVLFPHKHDQSSVAAEFLAFSVTTCLVNKPAEVQGFGRKKRITFSTCQSTVASFLTCIFCRGRHVFSDMSDMSEQNLRSGEGPGSLNQHLKSIFLLESFFWPLPSRHWWKPSQAAATA